MRFYIMEIVIDPCLMHGPVITILRIIGNVTKERQWGRKGDKIGCEPIAVAAATFYNRESM
jgi:hypothetical protein